MKYEACGAIAAVDSAPLGVADGLEGIYDADGNLRVLIDDTGGEGIYSDTGAIRVTDATASTDPIGKYASDGSWNIAEVDGLTRTGLYADNGSINIVLN